MTEPAAVIGTVLLPADLPPGAVPQALAGVLAQLRLASLSCQHVAMALAQAWAIPAPLQAAIVLVAAAADASGLANPYHNPAHTRDVLVNWANLAVRGNALAAASGGQVVLATGDLALGLLAVLGHDLLHDGIGNTERHPSAPGGAGAQVPFRLEHRAAARTLELLYQAGVAPDLAEPVADAILATDPVHGHAWLARSAIRDRPAWQLMALMLRDADLLASIALTAAEHDRQSALLGAECGINFSTSAAAETLFAKAESERLCSPAGKLFRPQFEALRALNRLRHPGAGHGCLSLEAAALRVAGL